MMKSPESLGRFPFNQNHVLEISGPKLNGTGKVPGEIFENLGIRFQCEFVRCALFLASTNRTFPWSSGNGSRTPPTRNCYFEIPIYTI